MKREFSAGGIVFNKFGQVLLTQSSSSHYWGFPKGNVGKDESMKEAALREVGEEAGVKAEIVEKVGDSKYVYTHPETKPASPDERASRGGEKVFKIVTMFLMKYISGDTQDHDWEVEEAKWFSPEEALKILSFSQDKQLLKKALKMR